MHIRVSKEELQKKLGSIQSIVEKKTTMPVLGHFLLSIREKDNSISATDLETAIKEPVEVLEILEEGELCMPARKLFEIVREIEVYITIESEGHEWVKVRSGRSNFRIACMNPEEFPKWPALKDRTVISLESRKLLNMIEKTIFSSGESDTRYTLNSLLFHIKPELKRFTVVGTDGHRLASMDETIEVALDEEIKVIIPRKSASELRKFLAQVDGEVVMEITEKHVSFHIGEVTFLVRLIEGTYPEYEQVLPANNEKKLEILREGFTKVLRRVSVISRDRNSPVKIDVSPGLMTVTSSNPDIGEAMDEVEIGYDGDAVSLGFNARYLLDALNAMEKEKVFFELQEPLSPTLLTEEGNDRYRCVVMPMRI